MELTQIEKAELADLEVIAADAKVNAAQALRQAARTAQQVWTHDSPAPTLEERLAATQQATLAMEIQRVAQRTLTERSGGAVVRRDRLMYGPHEPHASYFRDLVSATNPQFAGSDPLAGERLRRNAAQVSDLVESRRRSGERQLRGLGAVIDRHNPLSEDGGSGMGRILNSRAGGLSAQQRTGLSLGGGSGLGSTFAGPAFLIGDYADAPRPGRVVANLARMIALPKGYSVSIPAITGTSPTGQTAENVAPATLADFGSDSYITSDIAWIPAAMPVSIQALTQSSGPAFDTVLYQVLLNASDAQLEYQMISGTGTSGQLLGLLNVSGAEGVAVSSATGAALYSAIAQGCGLVGDNRSAPAETVLMRPSRWAWLAAQPDSSGRPFVPPSDRTPTPGQAVGSVIGKAVYEDAAIPNNVGSGTNQDPVIVFRPSDTFLLEGEPLFSVQTVGNGAGALSCDVIMARSAAWFPHLYPAAIAVIEGAGLAAPSGY